MAGTLGALLAERRSAVVGRDGELAALLDDAAPVVVVHGVAGAGKSALLRALRAVASADGATVVAVDGREVEPTPPAFLAAVGDLPAGAPLVLTVDHAERLRLIDGWLRLTFLYAALVRKRQRLSEATKRRDRGLVRCIGVSGRKRRRAVWVARS